MRCSPRRSARIKARLYKIQRERERLAEQLDVVDTDLRAGQRVIEQHLALLRDAAALYRSASDENKRRLNPLIDEAIYIERDQDDHLDASASHARDPYDALYAGQEAMDAVGRQMSYERSKQPSSGRWRRTTQTTEEGRSRWTVPLP